MASRRAGHKSAGRLEWLETTWARNSAFGQTQKESTANLDRLGPLSLDLNGSFALRLIGPVNALSQANQWERALG